MEGCVSHRGTQISEMGSDQLDPCAFRKVLTYYFRCRASCSISAWLLGHISPTRQEESKVFPSNLSILFPAEDFRETAIKVCRGTVFGVYPLHSRQHTYTPERSLDSVLHHLVSSINKALKKIAFGTFLNI